MTEQDHEQWEDLSRAFLAADGKPPKSFSEESYYFLTNQLFPIALNSSGKSDLGACHDATEQIHDLILYRLPIAVKKAAASLHEKQSVEIASLRGKSVMDFLTSSVALEISSIAKQELKREEKNRIQSQSVLKRGGGTEIVSMSSLSSAELEKGMVKFAKPEELKESIHHHGRNTGQDISETFSESEWEDFEEVFEGRESRGWKATVKRLRKEMSDLDPYSGYYALRRMELFREMTRAGDSHSQNLGGDKIKCESSLAESTASHDGGDPKEGATSNEPIVFAGFTSEEITTGETFVVDVWAFLPSQRRLLQDLLAFTGRPAPAGAAMQSIPALRFGSELSFVMSSEQLEVEEKIARMLWQGAPANISFLAHCPLGYQGKTATASVTVWLEDCPVANLALQFSLVSNAATISKAEHRLIDAIAYHSAFASYSRLDAETVLGRVSSMRRANRNIEIFVDVFDLRDREWVEELMEKVVAYDALFLFWSKNAMSSTWVDREWPTALEKKGIQFIEPMPLQAPHDAPPPQELRELNFTDRYVIMAKGLKRD